MRIVLLSLLLCLSVRAPAAQPDIGLPRASSPNSQVRRASELRGIWMHGTQVKTPAEANTLIDKIDRANLNAVFILVWYWGGQAFFQSILCPMGDGVQPGFDPLGYMVEQCHSRGIQVHAWFVNGAYGAGRPGHVLDKHPDWVVDDGGGGTLWYDFGKPEVRRFQADLMLECLNKYDVDGLHFDYIRYGPHQCYCKRCQSDFAQQHGISPLTEQQRKSYPTGAGISANPLVKPTTAIPLAVFSDGTPAIAANTLGKGMTFLLNWHAENEMPPAVAETVKLVLGMWTVGRAPLYITTTKETRSEYGNDSFEAARASLTRLGYAPKSIPAEQIRGLGPEASVVLPAVYVIPREIAADLERFVTRGGKLLIIDGPVKSMSLASIQHVTGFSHSSPAIHRDDIIQSTGRSPLVLKGEHQMDLTQWKYRMKRWAEYRKRGVSDLVRDVYRRAKARKPHVQVTAAVFASLESADSVYQDWPRWVRDRTIDYVIPMAYTKDAGELSDLIYQWKTVDPQLQRIMPGLAIYDQREGKTVTRDLELIRSQYEFCRRQGARGNMYFSLQYLSDPLVDLFRTKLYPQDAPAYTVPSHRAP